MPHKHRFFISPDTPTADVIHLDGAEAHHALHVVRVQTGDAVLLFDGQGRELRTEVGAATRRSVELSVREEQILPAPETSIHLCAGWLKRPKAIEFIVQHGTELGVTAFTFFRADHSDKAPRLDFKWERTAIEACKQCGRLWLPTFTIADKLDDALSGATGTLLLCSQHGNPVPLHEVELYQSASLLIGPEGDFSEREHALALDNGATPVSFGATTFRTEMAAVVATTLVAFELGGLRPGS
jgi:16S rRNA (uracil1498-N3)-methyltransferase